jgi:hypothetical protein
MKRVKETHAPIGPSGSMPSQLLPFNVVELNLCLSRHHPDHVGFELSLQNALSFFVTPFTCTALDTWPS